jgi:alpha-galactosidase/6-phospho-beta-glucosidase family protein
VPDDVAVEVPAVVNRKGIQPIRVDPLPNKVLFECIMPDWLRMEQNLEAFLTGDPTMLLWGALHRHQTRSYDQAVEMLEDVLSMPGHEELADHYDFPPEGLEVFDRD